MFNVATGAGLRGASFAGPLESIRRIGSRGALYAVLVLFAALYIVPAAVVFLNAFRDYREASVNGLIAWPQSFGFQNFDYSWNHTCVSGVCKGIAPNFFNSLYISVPSAIAATLFGALNGYVLSLWRFRHANLVFGLIALGVFIPGQIALLPWAFIMGKLGLANNVNGLVLIHIVQGLSFSTLFCRNYFAQVPQDLMRAARIDGAGFWRIFWRIILPLSPPILIVTLIWQFTSVWNEYLFGMVFTSGDQQPVTVALMGAGVGGQSAAIVIAALPPLLIYFFGGRFFVRGLTQGALK